MLRLFIGQEKLNLNGISIESSMGSLMFVHYHYGLKHVIFALRQNSPQDRKGEYTKESCTDDPFDGSRGFPQNDSYTWPVSMIRSVCH